MSSQRRETNSQASSRLWKSRIQRFLLACFFLQLVIVGTGLYYTDNLNFIFPKNITAQHVKTTKINNPIEEKDSVKFGLKETLLPVATPSPTQMNRTSENTQRNQTEDNIPTIEKTDTPVEIAEKLETKTIKTSFPMPHRQTIPVIPQNDGYASPVKSTPEETGGKKTNEQVYTVQDKDTLGLISQKIYGTHTKWRVIADANMAQLGNNPNILQPGMVLIIPSL